MNILEVKNLTKIYGKGNTLVKALDDVSFEVEQGEFVAIIGLPVPENPLYCIFLVGWMYRQAVR